MRSFPWIETITHSEPPEVGLNKYDLAIVGESVDDRGEEAIKYCKATSTSISQLKFNIADNDRRFHLDGSPTNTLHLGGLLKDANVLIEATTLGVAEICGIFKAAVIQKVPSVTLLYIEPRDYTSNKLHGIAFRRSFQLSDNRTFVGIPGFSINTSDFNTGNAVFFLGYEGERLVQALEQLGLDTWRKIAVFGVPAFQAGWETNAFSNNVSFLNAYNFKNPVYAAATSVYAAFAALEEIHLGSANPDKPTLIAPLGTKPHSIGAALFVATVADRFSNLGLVFDHPVKTKKRSVGTAIWHQITVQFQ